MLREGAERPAKTGWEGGCSKSRPTMRGGQSSQGRQGECVGYVLVHTCVCTRVYMGCRVGTEFGEKERDRARLALWPHGLLLLC